MNLTINLEKLRKNKIFVATPMYGGKAEGSYLKSCLDLQAAMTQYGIQVRFSFLFNESLITRARNYLVDEFLRSDCTHLLFIDSDIEFDPQDVLAMLHFDRDVIGGPYPKKSINWNQIAKAFQKNPKIQPNQLESLTGDFVFNAVPGTTKFNISEPLSVLEIGTGYMMVKRTVFEKFATEYPHLKYRPDHIGQQNFDGSRHIHAYFDTVIDVDSERYLSEDYFFCQAWRKIGGEIWLCPWMKTKHVGSYAFAGNMESVAVNLGSL